MRISRLRATNFRGWAELDLKQPGHALVVGEPRAGRTDLIIALTRALDPRSTRLTPSITDIHQRLAAATAPSDDASVQEAGTSGEPPSAGASNPPGDGSRQVDGQSLQLVQAEFGEVEVTLVDLDPDLEQEALGALEPMTADGSVDESGNADPAAQLGLRIAYRVTYDPATDELEHRVYYPSLGNSDVGEFVRVPTAVRLLVPVVFMDASRPLQLRAEGLLRRLVTDHDPDVATAALRALESQVVAAAAELSRAPAIADVLDAVFSQTGPARRAGDRPVTAADVQFLPEGGSLAGLLRAVQPVLTLDGAGPLALSNHGSTTSAVLAASEALILASSTPGALIIGDDLGEGLDGASTEHLSASLRAHAAQVWLTTRRAEVVRSFEVSEVVRLTRRTGTRYVHRVPTPADRKEVAVHRHVQGQLLPALTASTVAVVEGRHDLAAFSTADRRSAAPALPLSAHGVRLITADNGSGGGTSQIPRVAALAKNLGYHVVALIDRDPANKSEDILVAIEDACDAVVRLPETMAIERAILAGADSVQLRQAATVFTEFGQADPTLGQFDETVADSVMKALHKNGLHEQFLGALIDASGTLPPVIRDALDTVAVVGNPGYDGPKRVDLTYPPPAAGA